MSTNKLFLVLLLLIFNQCISYSQSETFDDILNVQIRNVGTIEHDGDVTGHYIFYKTEKIDKKTYSYKLAILNQDLLLIKNIEKIGSKSLVLLECVYNGNAILMKYLDRSTKEFEFEIYDSKGELSYSKKIKLTNFELESISQLQNSETELVSIGLSPVGSIGFVDIGLTKHKDYKYEVRFFDNKDINKHWVVESANTKGTESANFIAANNNKIVLSVAKRPSLMSTKQLFFTKVLDAKNGEILKEYDNIELGNYQFINGFLLENNEINLIGNYFKKDDSPTKDHPAGIVSYTLSENNELINKKKSTFGRLLRGTSKNENPGHLHFHDFIRTDSNRIYVVGEYFKKKADGFGIAAAALGNAASVVKLSIYDFVVAELNEDLKVEKIKIFDKESHSVTLPPGALMAGSALLGNYVKLVGGFDYRYTQIIKSDNPYFISTYFDESDEKDKVPKFKIVSNIDGVFTEDAVSLKTEATDIMVSKAKAGHILITEYFKKEKKMTLRLEKINI